MRLSKQLHDGHGFGESGESLQTGLEMAMKKDLSNSVCSGQEATSTSSRQSPPAPVIVPKVNLLRES